MIRIVLDVDATHEQCSECPLLRVEWRSCGAFGGIKRTWDEDKGEAGFMRHDDCHAAEGVVDDIVCDAQDAVTKR